MNGDYLLDTSVVIRFLGKEQGIIDNISKANNVFLCTTVVGELYYGAYNSTKIDENVSAIENLIDAVRVFHVDIETATVYGGIKMELKRRGTPIPENDIWIASIAIQHQIKLAGRDEHFKLIDGLDYAEW